VLVFSWSGLAAAERINCANEFRSGKLYFAQKIYKKSVQRFALAVQTCPDKAEYRARYAMALAQYGAERLVYVPTIPEPEVKQALIDSVMAMYELAGAEFDSSLVYDDGRKNKKFVRENRKHFWVDRYNQGIKLYEEKNYEMAELQFRLARRIDVQNPRAYSQGAIALIGLNRRADAAQVVQQGLEQDPEDDRLNQLLENIYIDAATDLTREAESQNDAAKAMEAVAYLDQVLERRGEDVNLLFKRGVAHMAAGTAEKASESEAGTSSAGERFLAAASDFGGAAEAISAEEDQEFHLACLFNQIQCLMNADDCDAGVQKIKEYLGIEPKDAAIWQSWAICLSQQDDSQGAVGALMVSKSLATAQEIPVDDAVKNAKEDESQSLQELGPPDFVYTYQEASSGNQINTWFWPGKRAARSFILGVKNGDMTW
jgi:Flp pilus assembly protein TadD